MSSVKMERVVIAGAGKAGRALYDALKTRQGYQVVGFIDDDPTTWGRSYSPSVLGGSEVLHEMAAMDELDTVVIAITGIKGPRLLRSALQCKMRGVRVYDMPTFYKKLTGKLPVEHLDDFWLVNTPIAGVMRNIYTTRIKAASDVLLSAAGLVLSSPVLLLSALAIRLESRGPVFFRQKRVGLNNRVFEVVKLRSMRADAEREGAVWAEKGDPRVTRVGRVIRKLRIDEIPQMWNVLRGEMSFVGPRPERPEFVSLLGRKIPYYSLRHFVKPGITGWAQVNYPYGASEEDALEKLKYDLFYIKHLSPILELKILVKTAKVVLFGKGAR
jgi:sugar transferase (PEP-CTERM system associated)